MATWTRDLMARDHPTATAGDFTLVEDTNKEAIVSSLVLIPQTWSYGGIQFGVGRSELVSTHPDYRRRGLIRAQYEVLHEWCAERGHMAQAITGIPWFYRQFGYEMALDLGGGRGGFRHNVPKLEKEKTEPFRVRRATEADLGFMADVYQEVGRRYLVTCVRDQSLWEYELNGRSEKNADRRILCIVETAEEEPVGLLIHAPRLWRHTLNVMAYELKPGTSWLAPTPSVLRYLLATGDEYSTEDARFERFGFWLETEHPVYDAMRDHLPDVLKPYAWYIRVPDLPGFLNHVALVLERRLAESPMVGHSAEIKVSFYHDGLRLVLENGKLKVIEPWQPTVTEWGAAGFPDLTFLQLVFGYRSLEELKNSFTDCWTDNNEARAVLEALFPKQASHVWPLA